MPAFTQVFRVSWLGVGYQGPAFAWSPLVRVLPTNLRGGDLVGACDARLNWSELAADAVLALNDLWYLIHYARELADIRGSVPLVGYLPLDGKITDGRRLPELTGFSALVTYTDAAARDLRQALSGAGVRLPVAQIGHGVDLRAFHPLLPLDARDIRAQRMRLAQAQFGLAEPAYVVLNAARPDPRKRIDLTLEGFARFAQGRPAQVRLCLHQAISHPQFVEPLRQQAAALGIAERIIWHPRTPGPITDDQLNTLYNACVVGINTALGEGFGLVNFEHAAAGVPQIVPAQDALVELWGDAALLLPTQPYRSEYSPLLMAQVDAADVSSALSALHDNPQRWQQLATAARQRTQADDLSWHAVGASLARLISELMPRGAS